MTRSVWTCCSLVKGEDASVTGVVLEVNGLGEATGEALGLVLMGVWGNGRVLGPLRFLLLLARSLRRLCRL